MALDMNVNVATRADKSKAQTTSEANSAGVAPEMTQKGKMKKSAGVTSEVMQTVK